MKQLSRAVCLTGIMVFSGVSAAMSHDIWATAENPTEGQPMVAILGYGHDFPKGEEIVPERVSLFSPLKVVDSKGSELAMKPGDKNFKAVTEQAMEKGSYLVLVDYKPTYWSNGPGGWVMKPKNEAPGATSCERATRMAKGIVNIGGVFDDFITKPIGHKLEIVPLVNPGTIKAGEELPLQVLYEGKPVSNGQIKGALGSNKYFEKGNRDFFAKTDKDGKAVMVPIKGGEWILSVDVRNEYPDKSVCDEDATDASLTFFIAD